MVSNAPEADWLAGLPIAHRGLFLAGSEREENTLKAVEAAVTAGYAVEIDVRMAADEQIVIFHDKNLSRLTERDEDVHKISSRQLQKLTIGESSQTIPRLHDVLDIIDGKVPLYIEVKYEAGIDVRRLGAGIIRAMEGYRGPVAVMSFASDVVAWFNRHQEQPLQLGLIIGRHALLSVRAKLATRWHIKRLNPHFLACDINLLPNSICDRWRAKGGKLLTWTVRDQQAAEIGAKYADALIFEEPAVTGKITNLF